MTHPVQAAAAPFVCDFCGEDARDIFVIGDDDQFACAECLPEARKQYIEDNSQFGVGA